MKTIKGPALFLAQFANLSRRRSIPGRRYWARLRLWMFRCPVAGPFRLFDLEKTSASRNYCDENSRASDESGIAVTGFRPHHRKANGGVHHAL